MRKHLRKIRFHLESLPCLILLTGILNGFSGIYFCGESLNADLIYLLPVPGILIAGILYGVRTCCSRFIPATVLAVLSSFLILPEKNERFSERVMNRYERYGGTAVFQLTESSLCGGKPEWIDNAPYFIQAELKSVASGFPEKMQPAKERVLLTISPGSKDLNRRGYGDIIRANGWFEKISPPIFRGSFDFPAYAKARNCSLQFHAESFEILSTGKGFLRRLFDWRGNFLGKLTGWMSNETARDMTPALLFGIRQTVSGKIKNDFLFSGTLHILSVSGFHIGLFFLAAMFFLSVLPYRFRWAIAPFPVLLYAVSTGMQAPAFRAFLMLLLWCGSHVLLQKSRGSNSLAAAAGIILLLNPYQLFDIGFLYSFLCVFFLILCSGFFGEIRSALMLQEMFYPDRRSISFRKILSWLTVLTGVSLTAWICSMAISLSCQSLFTPWAVPAYLLMLPFTWFCFILFLPGILLQWIPGAAELSGWLIQPALIISADIAGNFADLGIIYVIPPPVWLSAIFLIALAGIFIFRRNLYSGICALILFLCGFLMMFPITVPEPEIAILRNGAAPVPAVIFCDPGARHAIVWNVPAGKTARLVSDYLKTKGISGIDEIHFDSARSEICGGGMLLTKIHGSKAVYFHTSVTAAAKNASQILTEFPPGNSQPVLTMQKRKDHISVTPGLGGFRGLELRRYSSPDKGDILELHSGEKILFRKEYPFSNELIADRLILTGQKKAVLRSHLSKGIHQEFPE